MKSSWGVFIFVTTQLINILSWLMVANSGHIADLQLYSHCHYEYLSVLAEIQSIGPGSCGSPNNSSNFEERQLHLPLSSKHC